MALERDKGLKGATGTRFRESSMEERASSHIQATYKPATCGDVQNTTGLLKQDCDQFEIRFRQTCMRTFICLLGIACVGFGWLDF